MKFNKAWKTLERKGNGFIALMSEMEKNYNIEIFSEKVFSYGYCLMYDETDSNKKYVRSFKFAPSGSPPQYIDILLYDKICFEENSSEEWGYYSFSSFSKKMGDLKIRFGIHEYVMSITDKSVDLYGGY